VHVRPIGRAILTSYLLRRFTSAYSASHTVVSKHKSDRVDGYDEGRLDTYYLKYDTPRAGTFEPLRHLPKNKNLILGVIISKFRESEDIKETKDKVYDAASIIAEGSNERPEDALKRLGVSPQYGFASHSSGNAVRKEDMIAKLKLVRQLAESIWPGEL